MKKGGFKQQRVKDLSLTSRKPSDPYPHRGLRNGGIMNALLQGIEPPSLSAKKCKGHAPGNGWRPPSPFLVQDPDSEPRWGISQGMKLLQ